MGVSAKLLAQIGNPDVVVAMSQVTMKMMIINNDNDNGCYIAGGIDNYDIIVKTVICWRWHKC